MERIDQLESAVIKMAHYIALSETRSSTEKGYSYVGDNFQRHVDTICKDILGDIIP